MSDMKKILLDVATPKHAILANILYNRFSSHGYNVRIIARRGTQTIDLLNLFGKPYTVIGEYKDGLKDKLVESLKQKIRLLEYFDEYGYPDILWTHGNVPGIRVAYQLNIPIIYLNDTPFNIPVARLTAPLATYLITPEAWSKSDWSKYGVDPKKIIRFRGLEEVAWIKDMKPNPKIIDEVVGKNVDRLIVIRGREYKSSYSLGVKIDLLSLIPKLSEYATILYIPRYSEERKLVYSLKSLDNVVIPDKVFLAAEVLGIADLFITAGGTMTNEAALQGTPVISHHIYTKFIKYLVRNGLPVIYVKKREDILKNALKILRDPDRYRVDTKNIIKNMEDPTDIILKYTEKIFS